MAKQTFKQKLRNVAAAGLIGLTALTGIGKAAETVSAKPANQDYSFRLRTENTSGEQTNYFKNTFGVVPLNGEAHNKFNEFIRIYNFTGKQNGNYIDYTNWSFGLPKFSLGELENSVSLFGLEGDRAGTGFESKHSLGKFNLWLNAEAENLSGKDNERLGAGLDYNYGGVLNPGIGLDRISNAKGNTDYLSGKLIWNITKADQLGTAVRFASGFDKTNTVGGYYMHYGKEEEWGTRTRASYDWNDETDNSALSFESITVQNPLFSNLSGTAMVERYQGGIMSKQIFDAPHLQIERVPVNDRSKQGWVSRFAGTVKEKAGVNSGYVEANAGYTFPEEGGIKPGLLGIVGHKFGVEDSEYVGLSGVLKVGKNVYLEATLTQPISGSEKACGYLSMQYARRF